MNSLTREQQADIVRAAQIAGADGALDAFFQEVQAEIQRLEGKAPRVEAKPGLTEPLYPDTV